MFRRYGDFEYDHYVKETGMTDDKQAFTVVHYHFGFASFMRGA